MEDEIESKKLDHKHAIEIANAKYKFLGIWLSFIFLVGLVAIEYFGSTP